MKEGRYVSNLPLEEVTIAEVLRGHGYKTAFMGKWHLGTETYYYPEHQGFDVNVAGRDYGAPGSYFFPFTGKWKIPSTGQTLHKKQPLSGKKGDYLTDRLAEEAESFIRKNSDNPFFLMLSHYAVHTPLQGKPGKVVNYEKIPENKRQGKPAYAAMIESVDESVGRVTRVLRELGLEKSTLVIFTSDHGYHLGEHDFWAKVSLHEESVRVPLIISVPGKAPAVCGSYTELLDLYPTVSSLCGLDVPDRLQGKAGMRERPARSTLRMC
jgi:arylsulfatase A-like enzyme